MVDYSLTDDYEAGVRIASSLTIFWLLICSVGVAHADKRVALVIGNGAYQHTPALINPKNDAEDIGKTLRGLGFETIVATDLDRAGMSNALDRFSRTVNGAEIAMVYYSGHGMQFAGKNYLLPVDARLETADDVNRFRLMPLDDLFDVLQHAPGARIIILDACRNNPVEDDLKRRVASIRGGNRDAFMTRGLSRIEANGLIVAYATQANDVAADGTGNNSPFAKALLDNLATPNIDVRQMLFNVQDEVDRLTDGKQRPELSISLVGKFKLKVTVGARDNKENKESKENKENKENKEVVAVPPLDPAAQAWAVTRETKSQAVLEDFIRQFDKTVYGSMARARLEELKKTKVAAVPPPAHIAPSPPSAEITPPPSGALPGAGGAAPMGHAPTSDSVSAFDGVWQFEGSGGQHCPIKTIRFPRFISGGVISIGNGKIIGSIAKDGRFHFEGPSRANKNITVVSQGTIKGETGEGSYMGVGTRCRGTYQIRLVRKLNRQ
jgi:uncharacterized caspase-like protein